MRHVEPYLLFVSNLVEFDCLVILKAEPSQLHKLLFEIYPLHLDFHFRQAMLPDNDIWCDAILAVVEEDDPVKQRQHRFEVGSPVYRGETTYIPSGSMDSPV